MADLLSSVYQACLDGVPMVSRPVDEFAADYLKQSPSLEEAAKGLIRNQIIKCGTSGFLTTLEAW